MFEERALLIHGARSDLIIGGFFGMALLIALYELLLFLTLREKARLYYIIFVVSYAMLLFVLEGLGARLLWPGQGAVNESVFFISWSMALIGAVLCTREIFATAKTTPRLDLMIKAVIAVYVLSMVLGVTSVLADVPVFENLWSAVGMLSTVWIVPVIAIYSRKKNPLIWFYAAGWVFSALGTWLQILREWVPEFENPISQYGMYIGALGIIAFFSIALHGRFSLMVRERQAEKQKLLDADRMISLGIMVSGIAHEISNPANAVASNAAFLKKEVPQMTRFVGGVLSGKEDSVIGTLPFSVLREKLAQGISGIEKSADRIRAFIGELRDFSRGTQGAGDERVDVHACIEGALELIRTELVESRIRVAREYVQDLPRVKGSSRRLEQVLVNLLLNARNALRESGAGPGDDTVRVRTSFDPREGRVVMEVEDHGPGVDPETRDRMGTAFFTTRADKGGTGLGLYVSRQIIQDHGGRLLFEPAMPQGMIVRICLPPMEPDL
jgi:signal transduction histidine kinase